MAATKKKATKTREPKDRWEPHAVRLDYTDLSTIVEALKETGRAPELQRDLEATKAAMWRHLS